MIFVETSNHFYNNLDHHILSLNEIELYVFNLINRLEIEEYIYDVSFDDKLKTLGSYSFKSEIIKLNVPDIIHEAKKISNKFNIIEDEILFINLNILEAVLHEVMHGIQNCNLNETDFAYNILYLKELQYTDIISDELYHKYYYLFSYERDSIITSIENILHIIKDKYPNKDRIFEYFLSNLYSYLILGYTMNLFKIKSPAEKLYTELYHENTPTLSNIDTYDRMKLGYQMNTGNYWNFKRNKVKKILTKNDLL